MKIGFSKYQGAGNDFVILDNRSSKFHSLTTEDINQLCHRRLGIGADGLIMLEASQTFDFKMRYFNADGMEGSMCGNGARCLVDFAQQLDVFQSHCRFEACDGPHDAQWNKEKVVLKMNDVTHIEQGRDFHFLNTGSPHYVQWVDDLKSLDVNKRGREVRYNPRFKDEGTNVNFMTIHADGLEIRTYERGVEQETLACGTGAVACAIAAYHSGRLTDTEVSVTTLGGQLKVTFEGDSNYKNIFLSGPYQRVFDGVYYL